MAKEISLEGIATRNQVLLERLKAGLSAALVAKVNAAIAKADKYLASLAGDNLKDESWKAFTAGLAALKVAQTEILFAGMTDNLGAWGKLAEQQIKQEAGFLDSLPVKGAKPKIKLPDNAFKKVLDTPLGVNGEMLEPFTKSWTDKTVERVNGAMRKGWVEGKTVQQMRRELSGTKKRNYKDGIAEINRRDAETVTRTATQHVSNAARQELYKANPELVRQYTFVATLDSRTSIVCRSLDKKVFNVGEGPLPPRHPRCRSTTAPKLSSIFDIFDKGATRASMNGPVDAKLSYYEWLKTQSPEFQETALGPSRAKLFRDGGISAKQFADMQLDKNFKPLSLNDMEKLYPQVFQNAGL